MMNINNNANIFLNFNAINEQEQELNNKSP